MPNDTLPAHRRQQLAPVFPSVDAIFQAVAHDHTIPGVAYGIVAAGELVHSGAIGIARVGATPLALVDTAFRIASMTKSFAALAIMMLRDAGKLALDDPVAAYVPELATLVYPTRDSAPITIRQLLTMAAGWPEDNAWGDRQVGLPDHAFTALLRAGVSCSNAPGVAFEYSNFGYMVLGRVIRNVSGVPCLAYITQQILQPLGMHDSCWQDADVPPDRLALGYRWQDDAWLEEPALPSGGDIAAFGGLYSTVRDLARWVAFFLSAWPARDEADTGIARRSSLREMQQTWRVMPPDGANPALRGYGYGLFTLHNGSYPLVTHSGGLPGFGSNMSWAPDYGVAIVALANLTYAPMRQAATAAMDLLIGQSGICPPAVEPAAALADARADVIQLLAGWDDALADRLFAGNFFLDEDRGRWQARLETLRAHYGNLQADGAFEVENKLRGAWKMAGDRGECRVSISMAPTVPPRVQEMTIEPVAP